MIISESEWEQIFSEFLSNINAKSILVFKSLMLEVFVVPKWTCQLT